MSFNGKINKISKSSNNHKRMQSSDSVETYAYRARKGLVNEKEVFKCDSIIKLYKKWSALMML